ncbi:hypothetical protein VPH35_109896 [Triticum aestivum]
MAHQVVGAPLVSKMFYSHQLLARKAPLGQIWCVPSPLSLPPSPAAASRPPRSRPPAADCARPAFSHSVRGVSGRARPIRSQCGGFPVASISSDAPLLPCPRRRMAATLHAKINRKRLDKLDIIKICEEILNPSVPMALRLSGILMGGMVIVYERKVKLLYDDVSRLLIEINEAWKIRLAVDHTVLPKGKAQAMSMKQ